MPDKNQLPSSIQSQDQATAAFAQLIEDSTTALNIVSQRLNPALFNELSLMESEVVGTGGIEPPASAVSRRRSKPLSYVPETLEPNQ